MPKRSITIKRDEKTGFFSDQTVGNDAFNALMSIPGVEDVEIVSEINDQVELTYRWAGEGKFWETDVYLAKFGVTRADAGVIDAI